MPMKRSYLVLILILLLLVIAGGVGWYIVQLPSVADQLPDQPTNLFVRAGPPADAGRVPLGRNTAIQATAWGTDKIESVELWIDGVTAVNHPASGAGLSFDASFAWRPAAPGDHMLVVRAHGGSGAVATSDVVRVVAGASRRSGSHLSITPAQGTTLAGLAEGFDMSREQLVALNPDLAGLSPDQPLPDDATVEVLLPGPPPLEETAPISAVLVPETLPAPPPPPALEGLPPAEPLDPNPLWFKLGGLFSTPPLPDPPELAVAVDGCSATLVVTAPAAGASGLFVYRAAAGQTRFERIATLAASAGPHTFSTPAGLGHNLYYVAAFNQAGLAPGPIVNAPISDPACATPAQTQAQLEALVLTPTIPVERPYCYASLGDGPWTRLPAQGFATPSGGGFNLGTALNLAGAGDNVELSSECWGWSGGALKNLGAAATTFNLAQTQPVVVAGPQFALEGTLASALSVSPPGEPIDFSLPANLLDLPAPYDLELISDPQAGQHTLLWRWAPIGCVDGQPCADAAIDGYKVLNTHHAAVATIQGEAGLATFKRSSAGECFSVVAFKGDQQSPPSDLACDQDEPAPPAAAAIPAAHNLRETVDPEQCYQSTPQTGTFWKTICQSVIDSGGKVLAWDWLAQSCFPSPDGQGSCNLISDIEGFRVYDRYSGQPIAIATTAPNVRVAFLTPLKGVYLNEGCFSVRAYKGGLESPDSAALCVDRPPLANAASYAVQPLGFDVFHGWGYLSDGLTCVDADAGQTLKTHHPFAEQSALLIRQARTNSSQLGCATFATTWIDGRALFSLPTLPRPIEKAVLHFKTRSVRLDTDDGSLIPDASATSDQICAVSGAAMSGQNLLTLQPQTWPGTGDVAVDLTELLQKAQAEKAGQLSFRLDADANLSDGDSALCETRASEFRLEITVKP
jgi:hypothetical protein